MNDKRIGLSRLIFRTLVIAIVISTPFMMVGEWVPFAIVVTGFLFALFNPSVRREISTTTSKKKEEKKKGQDNLFIEIRLSRIPLLNNRKQNE